MTKQLYEEALADVKKLKEIAEDNAKKALIEAVAPRIKDLIEAELMRESSIDDEEEVGTSNPVQNGLIYDESEMRAADEVDPQDELNYQEPEDNQSVPLDLSSLQIQPSESGELEMSMNPHASHSFIDEPEDYVDPTFNSFIEKVDDLSERAQKFTASSTKKLVRSLPNYNKKLSEMVSEAENLYQFLQESVDQNNLKDRYESKLEAIYKDLNQLMEQKMKNRKSLNESELTLKLTGLPDSDEFQDALGDVGVEMTPDEGEEELDLEEPSGEESEEGDDEEVELDLDDEGSSEEDSSEEDESGDEEDDDMEESYHMESKRLGDNVIVEIDENMLRREIKRMKMIREAAESADVQKWGHGAGDVSDDFADDDLGDPFLDVDLSEMDKGDELDEMNQAADEDSKTAKGDKQKRSPGQKEPASVQKESLQRRLAAEKKIQLEAKAKAQGAARRRSQASKRAVQTEQDAVKHMKQANKMQAKKLHAEALRLKKQAHTLKEEYEFYATKFNESVRRTARLQNMLAEASKRSGDSLNGSQARSAGDSENLRKKLAETNLFNMKLLYTNKLLQNESLTKRQKADVIERLDEAKTEREVKLVYESLVKTLAGSTRTSLSENAQSRVVGSSSSPTRPASTVLSESYEADRWAKLAGIK